MTSYVIASSQKWFSTHFKSEEYKKLNIVEINNKEDLNLSFLKKINPKYIFFPHWNWKVDSNIYQQYECIVFHTAPLPYGRGGSPIQNMILNGFNESPVCALKMTDIIDGGPLYQTLMVSLDGKLSDIFLRISDCIEKLILQICYKNLTPVEQSGNIVNFKRLSRLDNELLNSYSLTQLYDRIRMVDAEGYPHAFINFGKYIIDFSDAKLFENNLYAQIKISENAD